MSELLSVVPGVPQPNTKEFVPTRMELLSYHQINIEFLSRGCIIRIGCKSIPFTEIEEGIKQLNEYIENPFESTKKWNKIFNQ